MTSNQKIESWTGLHRQEIKTDVLGFKYLITTLYITQRSFNPKAIETKDTNVISTDVETFVSKIIKPDGSEINF